ncbi:hypothetical protein S83_028604 [Arachis hypogaea]
MRKVPPSRSFSHFLFTSQTTEFFFPPPHQNNPSLHHRRRSSHCRRPSLPRASSVRRAPAPLLIPLFLVCSSRCSVALCPPNPRRARRLVAVVRRALPFKEIILTILNESIISAKQ